VHACATTEHEQMLLEFKKKTHMAYIRNREMKVVIGHNEVYRQVVYIWDSAPISNTLLEKYLYHTGYGL
jgi:hypothetical protein